MIMWETVIVKVSLRPTSHTPIDSVTGCFFPEPSSGCPHTANSLPTQHPHLMTFQQTPTERTVFASLLCRHPVCKTQFDTSGCYAGCSRLL